MTGATGQSHDEYDPAMLAVVMSTLERVLRCFGAAREHVTVIGGLAPSLLVPDPAGRAHVGTADVDLCLTLALAGGETGYYQEVAAELRRVGFIQRDVRQRFRWVRAGTVVDFLYPASEIEPALKHLRTGEEWERAAQRSLGDGFAALSVGYPILLEATRVRATFTTELDGAKIDDACVYVSGPAALVALKADALLSTSGGRFKPKDAYDIVWVLDELGPERTAAEAVELLAENTAALAELRTACVRLEAAFAERRVGPVWYANFVRGLASEQEARDSFERFAHSTVFAFISAVRSGIR